MNNRRNERSGANGRLPACAPLANPYVPFQNENPPKYEARKALIRGTLFPGLDLPFHGMVNEHEKALDLNIEAYTLLDEYAGKVQESCGFDPASEILGISYDFDGRM